MLAQQRYTVTTAIRMPSMHSAIPSDREGLCTALEGQDCCVFADKVRCCQSVLAARPVDRTPCPRSRLQTWAPLLERKEVNGCVIRIPSLEKDYWWTSPLLGS